MCFPLDLKSCPFRHTSIHTFQKILFNILRISFPLSITHLSKLQPKQKMPTSTNRMCENQNCPSIFCQTTVSQPSCNYCFYLRQILLIFPVFFVYSLLERAITFRSLLFKSFTSWLQTWLLFLHASQAIPICIVAMFTFLFIFNFLWLLSLPFPYF